MLRAAVTSGIVSVLAGLVCMLTRPAVDYPLDPGRLYAIKVEAGRAAIDLPLETSRESYLLVVSNLGRELEPLAVTLSCEPLSHPERKPAAALEQLAPPSATDALTTCPQPLTTHPQPPPTPPPEERTFYLHTSEGAWHNPAAHRPIVARLAGRGEHVRVYVDRDDLVDPRTVEFLIDCFDNRIRPTAMRLLGVADDVDGDGTLALLLTSWLGRMEEGQSSLGGLVRPHDFRRDGQAPFSNRADVVFLNASARPGRHLETLLAHEHAHAVTISSRLASGTLLDTATDEEAWLNEAISHVMESFHSDNWSNLEHRIAAFLAAPESAPLVVPNYYHAGLWRSPAPRGGTYLFLRWCVERHGCEVLSKLVRTSRRGTANLQAACGRSFEELYRRFAAELFLQAMEVEDGHDGRTSPAINLAPLDLSRPLEQRGLAGPRCEAWNLDEQSSRIAWLTATSSCYLRLAAEGAGPRRVTVRASKAADLQISLVRLPDDLPRLKLDLIASDDGAWRLAIEEQNGSPLRLSHVFWEGEPASGEPTGRTAHDLVREDGLSTLFDATEVPAFGRFVSRPLDFSRLAIGPITLAAVGVDTSGRRVTGWLTADLSQRHGGIALSMRDRAP